jgi:pimeloyl-ACP methyl ester carboxylesterase
MLFTLAAAPAAAAPARRCQEVVFPVALAAGQPADLQITGWLCARGALEHKTIQVLVHGGAYDHTYWDFPYQPDTYSYVNALTDAGYATLAIDRLGDGASSHPSGTALTMHAGAFALHQVVQALRSGSLVVPSLGRVRAERVELVAHSFGSFIASIEAATYQDVDGLILSGYSHTPGPGIALLNASLYPAVFDPKFADSGLGFDYFTTAPGTRASFFFYTPNADPAVIARDEQLKQTVTLGELVDIFPSYAATLGLQVPTLVVVGDFDDLTCGAPSCTASGSLAAEPTFYPPAACVEVEVVADAGHDLDLHRNAPTFFSLARSWSDRHIGASTRTPPPESCP